MTLAVIAGILSGIGSGFLAALVTPFAQRRAEETKEKQTARRRLISDARAMLSDANSYEYDFDDWNQNATFSALWPHLSDEVRREYGDVPANEGWELPQVPHESLRDEIARLEKHWNLV